MGGRREVSLLPHRPVTSSDLKQERLCFCESVSTFSQLVVASLLFKGQGTEHTTVKCPIHCLFYLNLAFCYELCDFPQIVRSDAI